LLDVRQPARFSIQFHLRPDKVFHRAAESVQAARKATSNGFACELMADASNLPNRCAMSR
jgi:hypothetical protein